MGSSVIFLELVPWLHFQRKFISNQSTDSKKMVELTTLPLWMFPSNFMSFRQKKETSPSKQVYFVHEALDVKVKELIKIVNMLNKKWFSLYFFTGIKEAIDSSNILPCTALVPFFLSISCISRAKNYKNYFNKLIVNYNVSYLAFKILLSEKIWGICSFCPHAMHASEACIKRRTSHPLTLKSNIKLYYYIIMWDQEQYAVKCCLIRNLPWFQES